VYVEEEARPGLTMPVVWSVLAAITLVAGGLGVGLAAYDSESAGVTATWAAAGPVGFALCGAAGAVVTHFLVNRRSALRVVLPFGCGCVGASLFAFGSFLFFAVIFPAL